jgi:hypothetical protein
MNASSKSGLSNGAIVGMAAMVVVGDCLFQLSHQSPTTATAATTTTTTYG